MKSAVMRFVVIGAFATAGVLAAAPPDDPASFVAQDARVMRRIVEIGAKDFPRETLQKIAREDLDALRGKQANSLYRYAHYERQAADRVSDTFSIRARDRNRPAQPKLSGENVYRLVASVPSRRLLVARNRKIFIDRIEVDYNAIGGGAKMQTFNVGEWIEPGKDRTFEIPEIAEKATAIAYATVDESSSVPATLELALVQASLVDNPDSPYAASVNNTKALLRAIDQRDPWTIKRLSTTLMAELDRGTPAATTVSVTPAPVQTAPSTTQASGTSADVFRELERIEDLMTGDEAEKREGLDRLHQLIRRLRQQM